MRFLVACFPAASVCAAAVCLQAAPAAAADLPTAPSSYPALGPGAADVAPDYWSGLSVGAGISVLGRARGSRAASGARPTLEVMNTCSTSGIMLGVQAATGYMRLSPKRTPDSPSSPAGLSPAGRRSSATISGQVTPYVITGVDFVRSTRFGGSAFNASDSINTVFSGPGAVQAVGTFGVGVNYRVTSNFSMGLEAIVHTNPGGGAVCAVALTGSTCRRKSQRRACVQPDRPA